MCDWGYIARFEMWQGQSISQRQEITNCHVIHICPCSSFRASAHEQASIKARKQRVSASLMWYSCTASWEMNRTFVTCLHNFNLWESFAKILHDSHEKFQLLNQYSTHLSIRNIHLNITILFSHTVTALSFSPSAQVDKELSCPHVTQRIKLRLSWRGQK